MQKINRIGNAKKRWLAGVLLAACFLGGCTRKEELLLLTEETAAGAMETGEAGCADSSGVTAALDEIAAPDMSGASSLQQNRAAGAEKIQASAENSLLYVHVCGAVQVSGVYELPAGSRVYEAVQAAGGFSSDADQNYVNQAQILTDGVKLVIPTKEEAAGVKAEERGEPDAGETAGEKGAAASQIGIIGGGEAFVGDDAGRSDTETADRTGGRININTASQKELCGIPGVGETRAAAIISYRESHGGFAEPEDIKKVNGIKEGMYEKIKNSICVD